MRKQSNVHFTDKRFSAGDATRSSPPNPNPDRIYNPQTRIERTCLEMMGGFDYLAARLRQRPE